MRLPTLPPVAILLLCMALMPVSHVCLDLLMHALGVRPWVCGEPVWYFCSRVYLPEEAGPLELSWEMRAALLATEMALGAVLFLMLHCCLPSRRRVDLEKKNV